MSSSGQPQRVRTDPRFAINALMRYMNATPSQRSRIIHDQKYPPTYRVTWYEMACDAITAFIAGNMQDESILINEMNRLRSLSPSNDNEAQRNDGNVEAIGSFLNSYDQIQIGDLSPSRGNVSPPTLMMAGVQISIRPEIEIAGSMRGRPVSGAIKLYFSKTDVLTDEMARYGAATIMRYAQTHASAGTNIRTSTCMVFDVFAGACHTAPSAITRRFQDLEAACEEIALRWPTA